MEPQVEAITNVSYLVSPSAKTERMQLLNNIIAPLYISNDLCCTLERRIRMSVEWGLRLKNNPFTSIKCFPTYVKSLPTGKEECECLAIDLGGTNLRCILVSLKQGREPVLKERKAVVPISVQQGTGKDLFRFVASEMKSFLDSLPGGFPKDLCLPLGFTFSFPCSQTALAAAQLHHWTKGFKCSNVEGHDVGRLLSEALSAAGLNISVVAVLNDTTGALMSCAFKDPSTRIGLILGTGTNACYVERLNEVETADGSEGSMVINTEWGAFGEKGELDIIRTDWDAELDNMTPNPGQQVLEKMVGGMYLGELIRIILVDLKTRGILLVGAYKTQEFSLLQPGTFTTHHLCEVESDPLGEFTRCRKVWGKLGIPDPTDEDCFVLRTVCEAVSRRCCLLLAAGLAALLKKMDEKDVTIAVDGSLFRYHPHFGRKIEHRIQQLMGAGYKFRMLMSEDGSGKGAAIIAAALSMEQGSCSANSNQSSD